MKTYLSYSRLITVLLFGLLLLFNGCKDDDDTAPTDEVVKFENISLTGAKEVPSNNSTATGTFNGTFNKITKVLSYTITYSGITPTAMHFHKGSITESGPVVIGIDAGTNPYTGSNTYTSPVGGSTSPLSADQETDLLAGSWYVNIHTEAYPGGEIRGQVTR